MPATHPASHCTTPVETLFDETSLGTSTGFFYQEGGHNYLVTNWHVITGKHPVTGDHLHPSHAEPNRLKIWQHRTDGDLQVSYLSLYRDGLSLWLQHDQHGSAVDVAILRIETDDRFVARAINDIETVPPPDFGPMVGKDLFVLGYPFGQLALRLSLFPIWKRASIATELDYRVENLPMFLVDTATREGMSGSLVVFVAGQFLQFMGVYSGRYGADDLRDVQLGRVWRARLISEIINGGVTGSREPT